MEHAFTRLACCGCGEPIDVPLYCGNRFCPVCSVARKSRIRHRLTWLIANAPRDPANRFRHLTLTISSQTNLASMIKKLTASFRRLRQRAYWRQHVDGGAFVIEVTGHPGAWHAHIHAIVYGRWLRWETLLVTWKQITGSTGVYITHIPETVAVGYLTKYLAKPDAPDQVSAEISDSLRGIRMFAPFGSWHKLNLKYKRPKHPCAKCGGQHWSNLDIMTGCFPETRYKDFEVAARPHPPNEQPAG